MKIGMTHERGECHPDCLCRKVLRVKALTCTVPRDPLEWAEWTLHFPGGRCLPVRAVLRGATKEEVRWLEAKERSG